ncbi:MAG: C13 family peptidase [Xanthobacteraceae bacterium]|nr:C13 family peptidase [Xanthobacteraceae bacterium]
MTGSGANAWLRRGGLAGACLALLMAGSPFDGVRADCSGATATSHCEAKDPAKDKAKAKEKTKPKKKESADAQQRALLKSAIGGLAPQRKGETDLYTIGVAGWADEDVFIKELVGTMASLAKVLPIEGRVVQLVNRADTAKAAPLATRDNIASAVRAVAQVMDKDEDILVLFMTSHGTRVGFGLKLPGRAPIEFAPRDLAGVLDGAGIKNRVVIVSACYSGIFVPPLANDSTIVITAADARNPSFGCAPGREWTYFGDAFFNRALRPGMDLSSTFNRARITISGWELADNLAPSNPQGHFGPALVEKLAPLFAAKSGASR